MSAFLLARQFGLSTDEWSFLGLLVAATITVLVPLYVAQFRSSRAVRKVEHEVTANGGVNDLEPTVKDFAQGAYSEAHAARMLSETAATRADVAAARAKAVADDLTQHIHAARAQGEQITTRLDALAGDIEEIRARSHHVRATDPEEHP